MTSAVRHPAPAPTPLAPEDSAPTPDAGRDAATRTGRRPIALHRLTHPIVTADSVHDCLVSLAAGLVRVLDVEHVAASLDAGDHGRVHVVANDATGDRLVALQRAVDEGPHVAAQQLGVMVTSPDLALEERWPGLVAVLARLELRAAAAFPLTFYGRRLGSVSVYDERPRVLGARDLAAANLLANAAAAAISYPHPPSALPDEPPARAAG